MMQISELLDKDFSITMMSMLKKIDTELWKTHETMENITKEWECVKTNQINILEWKNNNWN